MNNARCPACNGEFSAEYGKHTLECPFCGEKTEAVRARKYYAVFHERATAEGEAHGEKFFKFEEFLRIGSHHLAENEFDKAREAYTSATKLNPRDYRGYMGLVAVETKNYTDLKDTAHKPFLQRAVAVADEEQQKRIAAIYKTYDVKASMSEEEFEEYLSEKQKDYKTHIKKAILALSSVNEEGKKKAKTALIVMFSLIGAGAITLVLGFIFSLTALLIAGGLMVISSYTLSFTITRQKYNEGLYDFLVAEFNAMKDFGLTREQTDKLLDYLTAILRSVKDGDPTSSIDAKLSGMTEFLLKTGSGRAKAFLQGQKLTAKYTD